MASEREQYLLAIVGADITQFRKGMRDVRSDLGVLDESSSQSLAKLGRTLTYTLTAPLLAVGTAMVGAASNFDASMRNINSIAQLGESEFQDLSAAVLDFGKNTRGGAQMASEALYTIYSAGVSGAMAFDLMEVSTLTAEAGLSNITTTAEALTASMLAYGFTTEAEAMRASNALTRMVQVGVGDMNSFAGSIATFTPSSSILGVTIEEAFALNARLTQMGYSASEAAVRVNASMRSLIKPSEAMSAALGELGVQSAEELIQKYGSLTEGLIALQGTTDGTAAGLAELFSDTRALQGVIQITKDVDKTRQTIKDFNAGLDTATMDAWTQQTKSFAYQFDRAKTAVSALAIGLGSALLPILAPLINSFTGFILGLTEMDDSTKTLVVTVGMLAAALPPIIWLLASLISPFGAIVAGIAGLKYAFDSNFMGIADTVKKFATDVTTALAPVTTVVSDFIKMAFGDAAVDPGKLFEDFSSTIGTSDYLKTMAPLDVSLPVSVSYTVAEGDNLWTIWETNFKDKYANFGDFVTATGLDAKAIIQPGQIINIGGSTDAIGGGISEMLTAGVNMGLAASLQDESLGHMTAPSDFWTRLTWAITGNADKLTTALDEALVTLKPLIDDFGGKVLTQIAGAFSTEGSTGKGDTGAYGGLVSAVDGMGAALGGDLASTFPGITAGITTLVTNVGDWLLKEGVPTISRSAGYFAGQIGVMIGKGLSSVWGMLTGGGGDEASAAVKGAVADPFVLGVNDAMKENGVTNLGEQLLTTLAGSIGLAVLAKAVLFTGIASTITGAITGALALAFQAPAAFASVGMALSTALKSALGASAAGSAAGGVAGGLLISLKTAFMGALTGLGAFVTGTIIPGLVGALGLIATSPLLLAAAAITLGVTLGILISNIVLAADPELQGKIQSWADDVQRRLLDMLGVDQDGVWTAIELDANAKLNTVKVGAGDKPTKVTGTIQADLNKDNVQWVVAPGTASGAFDAINASRGWDTPNTATTMLMAPVQMSVGYEKPIATGIGTAFTDAALDPEVLASIDTATVGMMTAWGDSMGTLLADGLITQAEVETSITKPLYDALFPVIGEGGTVRMMWTGFVADVMLVAKAIGSSVGTLATELPKAFGFMLTSSTPLLDALILKFGQVETAANTMAVALGGLGGIVINPNVPLPVVPGVNPAVGTPDDLNVDVGVGGAGQGIPAGLLESNVNSTKGGDTNTEQTVTIYGAVSANEVLKVLEAKGIKLVRK